MHICLYSLPWDCKYERYFVFPEYPQSESGTSGSAPGCSTLLLFAVPPIQTTKLPEKLPNHGKSQQPTTSHRRDHNLSRRPHSSLLPTSKSSAEVHLPCRCPPPHSSCILSFAWPSFSPQLTNSKRTNNCKPSCSYFHSFDLSKAVIPTQIYKTNIRPINTLQIINLYSLVALLYISDHHNLQKYIFPWKKKKTYKTPRHHSTTNYKMQCNEYWRSGSRRAARALDSHRCPKHTPAGYTTQRFLSLRTEDSRSLMQITK